MLYLTYNNSLLTDGAGAQLQRIISIYLITKGLNLKYIHSPLHYLLYQDLQSLENNKADDKQMEDYNTLFNIPSDTLPEKYLTFCDNLDNSKLDYYLKLSYERKKDILLKITFAHDFIDSNIYLIENPLPYPWIQTKVEYPIKIGVHIRRGDLFIIDSNRMLPNEYYINCMKALSKILDKNAIHHEFHIYTEELTAPLHLTSSHFGIGEKIKKDTILYPDTTFKDLFKDFQNLSFHINEYPVKTLQDLTNSDILLASRSSFSYIAGIMKKKGCILFHPFWHKLGEKWIVTRNENDIYNNSEKILSMIK
jgi:hypothetical protein